MKKYKVQAGFLWLEPSGEQLKELGNLYEKGELKPIIGKVFDFSKNSLQEAHALSETHHARGKIVIRIK